MKTKNLHAATLKVMLDKMTSHAGAAPHPGVAAILADMSRLSDSVGALATIAENFDPELSQEARQARTMRAASKLGGALPAVTGRLSKLEATTRQGFDLAFAQNSGLVQTERAAEIRSHLKSLPDPGKRALFLQELLKTGDNESLGAVIFAPAYLSGLDSVTHSRFREQIEEQRLPELTKNREVFNELAGNLKTAVGAADNAVHIFSDPRKLADIEMRSKQAAEAENRLNSSIAGPGGSL